MKIGFVINDYETELSSYTTTHLALQAAQMGHESYYISMEDFAYTPDEKMGAHARKAPDKNFRSEKVFKKAAFDSEKTLIDSSELDVLMLRNDPSADLEERPWAQYAGIIFGQLAKRDGTLVLNDPETLANATNKMYFQYFPESVRPATIITRNIEDIKHFFKEHNNHIILKPLQGSGGKNVFMIEKEAKNLNQIVDAISRDGYIVAQEYLPKAKKGDVRLFLLDGKPIEVDGKIAAIHRSQAENDIRSNIHQGGSVSVPKLTKTTWDIVDKVSAKLVKDGMFLAGLDIVGDKLMEINVFSPGGLGQASQLSGVNFFEPVISAIQNKVEG